jgi:hypothetical protein
MNNDNVIDLQSRKKGGEPPSDNPKVTPGKYEFFFHPVSVDVPGGSERAEGYLKFGPQFLAVVDGPEDSAGVVFACSTPLVRFIRRIDSEDAVQATLAL